MEGTKGFHVMMFPWVAAGHMTPYLYLSNNLAKRGFNITFLLPKKAINQLQHLNLHPDLITFRCITIPAVTGLPDGVETTSDIPIHLTRLLSIALDRVRDQVEAIILATMPMIVIYDIAHWVPEITKPLGIKSICHNVLSAATIALTLVPSCVYNKESSTLEGPPGGYPSSTIIFRGHEMLSLSFMLQPFGEGITFYDKILLAMRNCDAISIRTCRELEGKFCDYISAQYEKPVFLSGPVLIKPIEIKKSSSTWVEDWLSKFQPCSVIYCAFGTQWILEIDQFEELVLSLEQTHRPFLVALKPPNGCSNVQEALPQGFEERVKERGVVCGDWVPQTKILAHKSVGCIVSHCGFGSMWEALVSDCQIVLVPHLGDQILNTRLMVEELQVAVEVKRGENGWFSKDSLKKAIDLVMDEGSDVGRLVRGNHQKWKHVFGSEGFMSEYVDKFVQNMHELVKKRSS